MLKSPKAKGKLLEKFIAEWLRNTGIDPQARPEVGSGSGRYKGDIATKLPLTIECKNTKNFHAEQFMKQAEEASMGYQEAIVIWKPPNKPPENSRVFMSLSLFEKLLKSFFKWIQNVQVAGGGKYKIERRKNEKIFGNYFNDLSSY